VRGIPVTTVPRTLFDLASVLSRRHVERAINEAEVRRLFDSLSLHDMLDRHPHRRAATAIKAILEDGVVVTRSDLEAAFLAFVEETALPHPEVNTDLFVADRWFEPDCLWRNARVIVELDSRTVHGTAAAFESDRARDRILHACGWRTVRVTARQLRSDREALAYDLRAILSSASGSAPSRNTFHELSVS
jgi:very-short-patch-repair endonuclease